MYWRRKKIDRFRNRYNKRNQKGCFSPIFQNNGETTTERSSGATTTTAATTTPTTARPQSTTTTKHPRTMQPTTPQLEPDTFPTKEIIYLSAR